MKKNLVIIAILMSLIGCSGGGGGSDTTKPTDDNPNITINTITVSGKADDDPIAGGHVVVYNLSNTEVAQGTTDDEGNFSIEVDETKIQDGCTISVTGGEINGEAFEGELKSIYSSSDDLSAANVTLTTTLVAHMAGTLAGSTILQKRDAAISSLAAIGIIEPDVDDWSSLEPSTVNCENLRGVVRDLGFNAWLEQMDDDLTDNDLAPSMMTCFPKAHGGIKTLQVGTDNLINVMKGLGVTSYVKVISVNDISGIGFLKSIYSHLAKALGEDYDYQLISAPPGMEISTSGVITFNPSVDSETRNYDFQIKVTNNGKGRNITARVQVLDSEVVATGDIGPEGGRITDEWEDVILTVPAGAVSELSTFKVLKSVDSSGFFIYRVTSTIELEAVPELKTPTENNYFYNDQVVDGKKKSSITKGDEIRKPSKKREEEGGWKIWMKWYATYIALPRWTDTNAENRLMNDSKSPALEDIDISRKQSALLFSLCDLMDESTYAGKEPVLFIHGFQINGGFGGGKDTWGQFPEILKEKGYAVFEFTWRTNARFEDAAEDLSDAINLIQAKTYKNVHIIAHSFGGLLARTYIQSFAHNKPYMNNVQSLVTLGTPHSGIFDSDTKAYDVYFPGGQDSPLFEGALQISVHQAGEEVERSFMYEIDDKEVDLSGYFGIDKNPGEIVAKLNKYSAGNFDIPINILVLMGLKIDRKIKGPDTFLTGDGLITFAGQRFSPNVNYRNNATSDNPVYDDGLVTVKEKILGVKHGAVPGGAVPEDEMRNDYGRIDFTGYNHSSFTELGITEPGVQDENNIADTGKPHAALTEITQWLSANHSVQRPMTMINIEVVVIDAETKEAIKDARIDMGRVPCSDGGGTDQYGKAYVNVPFITNSEYMATVSAKGYRTEKIDADFITGDTLSESPNKFPTIELQPDVCLKGDLEGQITDADTGLPLSGVSYNLYRNGIERVGTTDNNGNYALSDLVRGNYELRLVKLGYQHKSFIITINALQVNSGDATLKAGPPVGTQTVDHTNVFGMTFNMIPAGTFMMGSPENELGRFANETQHEVTLTRPYYMQTTEVTNEQWEAVMGSKPSKFSYFHSDCPDCAVEIISWDEIQTFIAALNAKGKGTYRLPTEAEWEYACRGGRTTAFANGEITDDDSDPLLDLIGWYSENSRSIDSFPVAQKIPNDWGLYDMHGNVWEWCLDWYGDYPSGSVTDPLGPGTGTLKVLRGGSRGHGPTYNRSAKRIAMNQATTGYNYGFRLVLDPDSVDVINTVPGTPLNVQATAGYESTHIVWDAVVGAVKYVIYWLNSLGVTPENGNIIETDTNSYVHTGLVSGTAYYYIVTAVNDVGEESDPSEEVMATPYDAYDVDVTNSLGMTFNLIPAGTFIIGSPADELGRSSDETQHEVTLTQPFYMQTTEVTQGQWNAVMGSNPSSFSSCGDDCPVEGVSWNDIQTFITTLNARGEGTYRLPTEAEWEYSARAGSSTAFANGDITNEYSDPNLDLMGWYFYNSSEQTHPVAQKQPNDWGLYDMHGNVWEWCQDWYEWDYPSANVTDPQGPSSGWGRVLRGGSLIEQANNCRSSSVASCPPEIRPGRSGFRLVLLPGQ